MTDYNQLTEAQVIERAGRLLFKDEWMRKLGHEVGLDYEAMAKIAKAAANGSNITILIGILEDIQVLIAQRLAELRR